MKKCSICGFENSDERTYCQRCAGSVRRMMPLSNEGRRRAGIVVLVCRALGAMSIICACGAFLWPRTVGADSEGPEPYVRWISALLASGFACVFLWLGGYWDWRRKGVVE
jgi:hypothetical protein